MPGVPNRATWCQVRHSTTNDLHKLALHLRRVEEEKGDLTPGQERFWDQIICELEWRSARRRRNYVRCFCALCFRDPFPEPSDRPSVIVGQLPWPERY